MSAGSFKGYSLEIPFEGRHIELRLLDTVTGGIQAVETRGVGHTVDVDGEVHHDVWERSPLAALLELVPGLLDAVTERRSGSLVLEWSTVPEEAGPVVAMPHRHHYVRADRGLTCACGARYGAPPR